MININIKNRFLIILFSITIIFILLTFFIYQIFFKIQNDMLKNIAADILLQMTTNIENEFDKIKNLSAIIMTDAKIQNDLKSFYLAEDEYKRAVIKTDIDARLNKYLFEEKYLNALYIFDNNGYEFYSRIDLPKFDRETKKELINKAKENNGGNTWFTKKSIIWPLLSLRTIREYEDLSLKTLGTLVIGIDIDSIIESAVNSSLYYDIELAVLLGDIVYLSDKNFNVNEIVNAAKYSDGANIININKKKYLVNKMKSSSDEWNYLSIFPYHEILKILYLVNIFLFIVYLFIFILIAYFGIKFTKSITNPIEYLANVMKRVEDNKFDIKNYNILEYKKVDEIGVLYKEFKIMLEKIDNLINENYKKQIISKDAQYRALQAQINPHFLYNTLESINWIAKVNNQDKIARMVKSLGNLLRVSINSKVIFTIKEQIDLLNDYISIQRVRYEERLNANIVSSDEVYSYGIPKLIIQPIVENSIKYGLEVLTGNCDIKVTIAKKKESIEIIVSDNGPGMKKDFIKKLIKGKIEPKGSGIGFKNIYDRLMMIYRKKFSIKIESEEQKGTSVIITIPAWSIDYYNQVLNIKDN